ncbi:hypothetical protein [Sporichthya sp.]|uniref:hypothetical protein n=1 Tax=Sporichthya sp. TaxID=65475 RepID=UPI00184BAE07|nr:hypothetical protein [Sporichthya sp.]MBA3741792.1 hypothetical protein [Sporichthya sp.]
MVATAGSSSAVWIWSRAAFQAPTGSVSAEGMASPLTVIDDFQFGFAKRSFQVD